MFVISDKEFEFIISEAMDSLPKKYIDKLQNVVIVWADEPTVEQRDRLKLHSRQSLFGLYEGVPKPGRGGSNNMILPDKITIFRNPILASVNDLTGLKEQVRHTLWHEIAHHYGLNHEQINRLE